MRYLFEKGSDGNLVPVADKDASTPAKCSREALEFKSIMVRALDRFLEDNEEWSKKKVALELDATQADLSHWLSTHCDFTIPGHKVRRFCEIVQDNSLAWHIQEKSA